MKRREVRDGGGGGSEEGTSKEFGKNRWKRQKRNEQRLGGKGLSLEAFANAKSRPSGYNPTLISKSPSSPLRHYFLRFCRAYDHMPTVSDDKDGDKTENSQMRSKTKKKSLLSLREEYEKKHTEVEKAKTEREAIIQAKKEERAKAEARRKAEREKMFKKTRSGQPVMKYRIEHLLEGLLDGSK
ncbi:hypothetical protein B296_00032940 [Ensete ventricosum]|uniref:rRNA-processing protein FYV7 n=1 Tax=Ensete ventricosum TaxID=4639 RepID=A0A426ZQZ4_ENSVE|nr:hypothetical protein B296_00032940 [Ensete ventricosum]